LQAKKQKGKEGKANEIKLREYFLASLREKPPQRRKQTCVNPFNAQWQLILERIKQFKTKAQSS
jgi:hypothetical protein